MLFSSLPDFIFSQWTIYHFKGVFCHQCWKQNLWLQLFLLFSIGFIYFLLLFFFLRNFLVITFHWKAVHYYRLNNCWNLQGPFFLATLLIGWIGRFGGWAGDFFFFLQLPRRYFEKLVSYVFFLDQLHNIFPLASSSSSVF